MFFPGRYSLPYLSSPSSALSDRSPFFCSHRKSHPSLRRERTPDLLLHLLNALIKLWSGWRQHLSRSKSFLLTLVTPSVWIRCWNLPMFHILELIPRPYSKKKNQSRLNQLDLTVILSRYGSECSKVPSCLTCATPASVNNTCNFNWNHLVAWNGMNGALLAAWQLPEPGRRSCRDHRGHMMLPWSRGLIACRYIPDY